MTSGFSGSSIAVDLGWMQDVGIIAERKEYRRHREKVGDMGAVYAADLLALLDHSCGPGQSPPNCAQESQLLVGTLTPPARFCATLAVFEISGGVTIEAMGEMVVKRAK